MLGSLFPSFYISLLAIIIYYVFVENSYTLGKGFKKSTLLTSFSKLHISIAITQTHKETVEKGMGTKWQYILSCLKGIQ